MITTIAEAPELGADYIQLVIENTQSGALEIEDIPTVLEGLSQLAIKQSVYVISWLYRSQPFSGVIFPEAVRFSINDDASPHLHIPVEGHPNVLDVSIRHRLTGVKVVGVAS